MEKSIRKGRGRVLLTINLMPALLPPLLGSCLKMHMDHLNLFSGLDKQTYALMEMAERHSFENIRGRIIWICSDSIHHDSTGVTLSSIPNHGNRGTSRHIASFSSESRWKIFHVLNVGTRMATFCMKEQIYGKVTGTGLYLWWAGAKRNKTGIIFRVGNRT